MLRKLASSSPDRQRFRVHLGTAGALADIRDLSSGFTYRLYRAEDICPGKGWSILPQEAAAPWPWTWESFEELLSDLWQEIEYDSLCASAPRPF